MWGERALGQRGEKLGRGVDWAACAAWAGASLGREKSSGRGGKEWAACRDGREWAGLGLLSYLSRFFSFLFLNFSIPNSNKV